MRYDPPGSFPLTSHSLKWPCLGHSNANIQTSCRNRRSAFRPLPPYALCYPLCCPHTSCLQLLGLVPVLVRCAPATAVARGVTPATASLRQPSFCLPAPRSFPAACNQTSTIWPSVRSRRWFPWVLASWPPPSLSGTTRRWCPVPCALRKAGCSASSSMAALPAHAEKQSRIAIPSCLTW